jgi:hypothetical protein
VKLSDAELFGLEHRRQLLPGSIALLQAKLAELAEEIKSTLSGSGIDGQKILDCMRQDADRGPGEYYARDAQLLALFQSGLMVLP